MMDRATILEYSKMRGLDPYIIENDYLQHIVLSCMFEEFSTELVFKGGTALQKIYGLNRLSKDLDFNLSGESTDKIKRAVARVGDFYKSTLSEPKATKHGFGQKIYIDGPSFASTGIKQVLPITFNTEEELSMKPVFKTINPSLWYKDPDLRVYSLYVMDEREIMAEKIRALLTRKEAKPRDLYDIWFMLGSGIVPDMELARKKVEFDHGKFSNKAIRNRIAGMESKWYEDLSPLIKALPPYAEVSEKVIKALHL